MYMYIYILYILYMLYILYIHVCVCIWGGGGGEDIVFPGVLKKAYRKYGNSRDQLKKKWDFQGCSRKNHPWNIHGF